MAKIVFFSISDRSIKMSDSAASAPSEKEEVAKSCSSSSGGGDDNNSSSNNGESEGPDEAFVESIQKKCEKYRKVTMENQKKKTESFDKLRDEFKDRDDVNALIAAAKQEIQDSISK